MQLMTTLGNLPVTIPSCSTSYPNALSVRDNDGNPINLAELANHPEYTYNFHCRIADSYSFQNCNWATHFTPGFNPGDGNPYIPSSVATASGVTGSTQEYTCHNYIGHQWICDRNSDQFVRWSSDECYGFESDFYVFKLNYLGKNMEIQGVGGMDKDMQEIAAAHAALLGLKTQLSAYQSNPNDPNAMQNLIAAMKALTAASQLPLPPGQSYLSSELQSAVQLMNTIGSLPITIPSCSASNPGVISVRDNNGNPITLSELATILNILTISIVD
jgi:hypothetical protein